MCRRNVAGLFGISSLPFDLLERLSQFEGHRQAINEILAFSGLEYGADGEFRTNAM